MIRAAFSPVAPSMHVACAWCGSDLGRIACVPSMDGKTSHGMCEACADDIFGQGASEADRSHKPDHDGSTPSPASIFTAAGKEGETVGVADALHGAGGGDPFSSAIGAQSRKCDEADDIKGASPRPALDYFSS